MTKNFDEISILRPDERVTLRLRALYESYGYKKFSMVKFEEYDFYSQNMDFLKNNRLLTFTGVSGKLMALRPDVTMSIVKATKANPEICEKLYYTENVYRADGGASEFKESSQIGLEHIGRVSPYTNVEIISLAVKSLNVIQNKNVLDISHMGFLNGALAASGANPSLRKKLLKCIEDKNAHELRFSAAGILSEDAIDSLVRIVRLPSDYSSAIKEARDICSNDQMKSAIDELEDLYSAMCSFTGAEKMRLDFSIGGDEEYYNGITFRGYIDGAAKAVLSGGRYDPLLNKMGKPGVQAIGFAIYFDELERYLNSAVDNGVDAVVIYNEGIDMLSLAEFVNGLIQKGLRVWTGAAVPEGMVWEKMFEFADGGAKEVVR